MHYEKSMRYERYGRFWAVYDAAGQLVCLAVYKKGAEEVLRRLAPANTEARYNNTEASYNAATGRRLGASARAEPNGTLNRGGCLPHGRFDRHD